MAKNNEKKTQVVLNKKVSSKSFVKVYMTDFLVALNIISSKSVDVLAYLFEIMRANDNLIIATYEQIAKGAGTSERTVYMLMQKLMKANVISKQSNGVYMMNPKCMIKGDESKRQLLVNYFVDSTMDDGEIDAFVDGDFEIDEETGEVTE